MIDAELVDPYTIRFVTKEPYFLNESVLGGITLLPRHYYDPENLLQRISVRQLAQDPAKLPAEAKKFGEQFNRNFNRNPLGSGPYKFSQLENRPRDRARARSRTTGATAKKASISRTSIG